MQTFTTIKDISQIRRMPRLGKIRLGVKVKSGKSGREYPKETAHFVVPPEVADVYGDEPTELDVLLPMENIEDVFPQAYKFYGSQRGVKCIGNGEIARRLVDDAKRTFEEVKCPCELLDQKKCARRASLMVILPKVSMGGIYQIDTTSFNSIVDINSGIDYIRLLIGRVAMVPLKLKRVERQTHHEGHAATHYTLVLHFDGNADAINSLMGNTKRVLESVERLALEAPEDVNPEFDNGVVVEEEDEGPQAVVVPQSARGVTVSGASLVLPVQQAKNAALNKPEPSEDNESEPTEEEINGPDNPPFWKDKGKGSKPPEGKAKPSGKSGARISVTAIKEMVAAAAKAGMTPADAAAILASHGYDDSSEVLKKDYDAIMAEIKASL